MAATARAIESPSTEPANDTYPKLEKGEFLMRGLNFSAMGSWGSRHLHIGKHYNFDFGVSGVVERIVALPSGVCRAWVREASQRGVGKLRVFLYFPTGSYGPEASE